MTAAAVYRRDLAGALVANGAVQTEWVRRSFEETPRKNFVPRFYRRGSGRKVLVDGTDPRQRDEWLRGVYADDVLTSATDHSARHGR